MPTSSLICFIGSVPAESLFFAVLLTVLSLWSFNSALFFLEKGRRRIAVFGFAVSAATLLVAMLHLVNVFTIGE